MAGTSGLRRQVALVLMTRQFRLLWAPLLAAAPGISLMVFRVPVIQVPVAVMTGALVLGSNYAFDREAEKKERRADARHILRYLLADLVRAVAGATGLDSIRANVMLVEDDQSGLRIAYATSGYSEAERRMVWRDGQGCVGRAWATGGTQIFPCDGLAPVSTSDIGNPAPPMGMTDEQIATTAGQLVTVVATPLPHPISKKVLGMVSIDSKRQLTETQGIDAARILEELRRSFGAVLDKAGLKFPPDEPDSTG